MPLVPPVPLVHASSPSLADPSPPLPLSPRVCSPFAIATPPRQCVAIVDTGTTGMTVSDGLYDSDELPLPGNAMRAVAVEVLTERGRVVTFDASRPRRRLDEINADIERVETFPFIVTPVSLRWFDNQELKVAQEEAAGRRVSPASIPPHVLTLGLAFLSKLQLTIDTDDMRLTAVEV
jgi:hypothetical protein